MAAVHLMMREFSSWLEGLDGVGALILPCSRRWRSSKWMILERQSLKVWRAMCPEPESPMKKNSSVFADFS